MSCLHHSKISDEYQFSITLKLLCCSASASFGSIFTVLICCTISTWINRKAPNVSKCQLIKMHDWWFAYLIHTQLTHAVCPPTPPSSSCYGMPHLAKYSLALPVINWWKMPHREIRQVSWFAAALKEIVNCRTACTCENLQAIWERYPS